MTVVLCGCGGISRAWLEAAAKVGGIRILGLVDLRREAAEKRAAEFGLPGVEVGTDLLALIQKVRPMAVFDCTVPEAHADVTILALEQGCHVLGEKPMADSMENARRMVRASGRTGKIYAVTQTRRYAQGLRRIQAFLRSGALGTVHTIHSDFFIGAHFGGFRDTMKHVLLLDMAIHTFDAARMLSGADPVSVQAFDWNPSGSWYAHGASAVAAFKMRLPPPPAPLPSLANREAGLAGGGEGEGGELIYTYRGSWCADGLPTTWECSWRILGTRGTLLWDGGGNARAEIITQAGGFNSKVGPVEVPPAPAGDGFEGHAGVLREFRDCVLEGRVPETACTDNIRSLAMVLSAIESAESGNRIPVQW